jgi:catechol 2,3-dioxygenase-like lactoylglutathione lyase family enzyme
MISGGNATVFVSSLDDAIQFYVERLGLKLTNRFGSQWATLRAGPSYWTSDDKVGAGLTIALHPASSKYPPPGTPGAVGFGLETYMPIESVVSLFGERGVRTEGDIIRYEAGNCISVRDQDGTATYINEFPPHMLEASHLTSADDGDDDTPAALVAGGHAIVYVSDMDASVRFYTGVLGMKLTYRYEDKFATAEAGALLLAIHPQTPFAPPPGTKGSVVLGLSIDEPIERVVSRLTSQGVRTLGPIVRAEHGDHIELADPDGNTIVLHEVAGDGSARAFARASGHGK